MVVGERGRPEKHPKDRRTPKTHTLDPTVYRQFKEWCKPLPVSQVLERLMVQAMDIYGDPLSLHLQIQDTEKQLSDVKWQEQKSRIERESIESLLMGLRDRQHSVQQEELVEQMLEEKMAARLQHIKDKYIPLFRGYPSLHNHAALTVEVVKQRTSFFQGKSYGECVEIMDIVFPGWK